MDAKSYVKAEMQKHIDAAKAIVEGAEASGRSMTEGERADVAVHTSRVTDLQKQLADITSAEDLKASIDKLGKSLVVPDRKVIDATPAKSLGDAFTKSAEYQALLKRGTEGTWSTGAVNLEWFGAKANETTLSAGVPGEDYVGGVVGGALQPNTVMGVLPQGTTDSNIIRYIAETTTTNAADDTAELAAFDQSILVFADSSVEVEKVATILYVSDEFLQDVSGMRSYLDGRLSSFVSFQEEEQVLNGNGSSPQLDGLFQQVTQAQALGADTVADAIYKAKTQVRTGSYLEPTHIAVHPTDWQTIRLSKDGNDNYMNGLGPFNGGGIEPPVWGLTPLVTSRVSQGTALVGAFSNPVAVQLFRRGGITVEATNSHGDLFSKGQVAIRASSRLALVLYRPAAFCEVTGL